MKQISESMINMNKTDEKEQFRHIISEYDNVVAHYDIFTIATRGARRLGEKRTNVYSKKYSSKETFITWASRIRSFLERSSVSKSDESNEILNYMQSFRGFGEEAKLGKLYSMLCALYDNWDLLSQVNGMAIRREKEMIEMTAPKFEFKCNGGEGSLKSFSLKNVSPVHVSEINVEAFYLLTGYGDRKDLFTTDINTPTSLGPDDVGEFTYENQAFKERGIGYKELRLVFIAADAGSNKYRCIASKNVEDKRDYMLGEWPITVELIRDHDMQDKNTDKPKVFISYNWESDETADEVEKRLSPIALVLRDKSFISPWASIGEFMKKIRETDLVVVIISDKYLKSIACLFEIMQLLKDDDWITHSMFLVEDSAKGIYSSSGQIAYIKYWEEERKNLEKALEGINPALVTSQAEDLKKIHLIQLHINDFMKSVADRNNPDLKRAIDAVVLRVQSSCRESETEEDIRQPVLNSPVFDVKIIAINKKVPGTADVFNPWSGGSLPKHKNVLIQVELCNNAIIRNLKVFGRGIEAGIVKQNMPYQRCVCYMESPDTKWGSYVVELSRDLYPAGEDGIPKLVTLEYLINQKTYQQVFKLSKDRAYIPIKEEEVIQRDIQRMVLMKNQMKKDFLKPGSELKKYSREDLWKNPEKRFISDEVIIISTECKDFKWNTDGGYGKYEVYDFCDEGLLCWDNTGMRANVEYYDGDQIESANANRMLCLPYEKVITYDLDGNSSYYMPIIYAEYPVGDLPFKFYYRDSSSGEIINNGVIVGVEAEK